VKSQEGLINALCEAYDALVSAVELAAGIAEVSASLIAKIDPVALLTVIDHIIAAVGATAGVKLAG